MQEDTNTNKINHFMFLFFITEIKLDFAMAMTFVASFSSFSFPRMIFIDINVLSLWFDFRNNKNLANKPFFLFSNMSNFVKSNVINQERKKTFYGRHGLF